MSLFKHPKLNYFLKLFLMHVLCMYLLSKLFSFILLFSFCVYTFLSFYSHF